jgi:hypothetical protein
LEEGTKKKSPFRVFGWSYFISRRTIYNQSRAHMGVGVWLVCLCLLDGSAPIHAYVTQRQRAHATALHAEPNDEDSFNGEEWVAEFDMQTLPQLEHMEANQVPEPSSLASVQMGLSPPTQTVSDDAVIEPHGTFTKTPSVVYFDMVSLLT